MLNKMAGLTVGRKQPDVGLSGVHLAADSNGSDEAADHFARKRNVKCASLSAFWFWNSKKSSTEIEMLKARTLDRIRSTSRQQEEQVEEEEQELVVVTAFKNSVL